MSGEYICFVCGWHGTRINEQAVKLMPVNANWRFSDGITRDGELGPVTVYACHKCGMKVQPKK